jgi:hypothetical protein
LSYLSLSFKSYKYLTFIWYFPNKYLILSWLLKCRKEADRVRPSDLSYFVKLFTDE